MATSHGDADLSVLYKPMQLSAFYFFCKISYTLKTIMLSKIREQSLYIGLIIVLAGILGSLYFSEVMGLAPCVLCWYQRIALYPLAVVFAVGIIRRTAEAWHYAVALIVFGWFVALYNTLLIYKVIPEITSCAVGIPCSQITWSLFGVITIPLLSFVAFSVLFILYLLNRRFYE